MTMNMYGKTIAKWTLSLLLVLPPTAALAESSTEQALAIGTSPVGHNELFSDVGNHWAANAIYGMTQYGIISGYDKDTFKPDASITREEFSALLAKTFSLPLANVEQVSTYRDIEPSRWSFPYIVTVKEVFPGTLADSSADFYPQKQVTREEFTAALVKALGYSEQKPNESGILDSTFRDAGEITETYRKDIAVAVELKLVQGQSNRMFIPKASISRAEVASILYRAIQMSVEEERDLAKTYNISVPDQTSNGIFELSGTVPEGSEIIVNGSRLDSRDGTVHSQFQMDAEGIYNITIAVKAPGERVHFFRKKITYQKAAPVILFYKFPTTETRNKISISGKVSYEGSKVLPELFINNEKTNVYWNGEFSKDFSLEEGSNQIRFKAVAEDGRTKELTKEVIFTAPPPVLSVGQIPASTKSASITISGSVKDVNDEDREVYVDGYLVEVDSQGAFSRTINLSSGKNTIQITAQNKYAKVSTIIKTIELQSTK